MSNITINGAVKRELEAAAVKRGVDVQDLLYQLLDFALDYVRDCSRCGEPLTDLYFVLCESCLEEDEGIVKGVA